MAVIDQVRVNDLITSGSIASDVVAEVKKRISAAFWIWFRAHQDDVLMQKKFLMISVSLRVKQLRPLFNDIFGTEPL